MNFFQAMHTRQQPVCDADTGHYSTALAHLGNMALRAGQPVICASLNKV
jgi:hypothetical protein